MKAVIIAAMLLSSAGSCNAQTIPVTPNLGLQLIPDGYQNWGVPYRTTMNTIDSKVAPLASPHFTGTATAVNLTVTGTCTGCSGSAPVSSVFGRTGAITAASGDYNFSQISGQMNFATQGTGLVPVANGGTGTASPGLIQGTNVTITGTWPNQTINSTASSGFITSLTTTGTSGVATVSTGVLNIPNYTYTLPQATTSVLGGVKPDGTTCTTSSGVLTCPGTGGISGLTAGYIPQAMSGTSIGNSLLDYGVTTASTFTFAAPVAVSGSGPSQLAFTYNATSLVPGSSTTAVYGVNSSGQAVVSEAAGAASRVCTAANGVCASSGIANITVTLPTTAIAANTCTAPATTTMTGLATTSTFTTAFATNPNAVTGWGSSGGLTFTAWPTVNTLNWSVCNSTASSITPGAMTLNVGAR